MARRSPLLALYLTRLREFYRQPARIFWVYGFPTVLAVLLSLAFRNRPPAPVVVDLIEGSPATAVKQVLDARTAQAVAPGIPPLVVEIVPRAEAERRLKAGKTPLVIEARDPEHLVYQYDPTRADAVAARQAFDDAYQRALGRAERASAENQLVTEPGSRYIDRLIPGLIGVNTMGGGLWGIGFLLVNFRIAKLLKRFKATPMPRRDFLLALLGARLTFLVPDLLILLALGVFAFGMPIKGSLALVVLIDVFGALAFAGIGMLVASRAETTETVSGLMNLVMLPMWLFSGVFFSSALFPGYLQPFIQALPLTQLVDGLRMVLLEGAGIRKVVPNLAILGTWAVGTFLLALRIFKWT